MRILAKMFFLLLLLLPSSSLPRPKDDYQQPEPVQLTTDGRRWVERTLKELSLEEKVGQMLSCDFADRSPSLR